jgi:hypothetical protein
LPPGVPRDDPGVECIHSLDAPLSLRLVRQLRHLVRLLRSAHARDTWRSLPDASPTVRVESSPIPPVTTRVRRVGHLGGPAVPRGAVPRAPPANSSATGCPRPSSCQCRPESIAVRHAGAALILDSTPEGWSSHWAPSATERVAGLRCEGVTNKRFDWPLVFVAPTRSAPGIEWAFLHDDAVQGGAHRWMPALK